MDTIMGPLTRAEADVIGERRRHVRELAWTPDHDDRHLPGALAFAGACYAISGAARDVDRAALRAARFDRATSIVVSAFRKLWPWAPQVWRPKNRRADLVRAAALILAELEKVDRLECPGVPGEGEH